MTALLWLLLGAIALATLAAITTRPPAEPDDRTCGIDGCDETGIYLLAAGLRVCRGHAYQAGLWTGHGAGDPT